MQVGTRSLFLSSSLTLTLGAAQLASAQATTHKIFGHLQSTHAHSVPGPIASTPDGETLFVAEAGVLAVIDADEQSSYAEPIKILPISSHGVRPVELLLDPAANLAMYPDGDESILYVAGGRLGLWAMRADPRTGEPMPAARIDDASTEEEHENEVQESRRWCNDVEILHHDDDTYLLALFAEQGCSRLRLYEISRARGVLNDHSGEETGNEIWCDVEVELGGNCQFETPRLESFGFGLAVDGITVYVAMGPYGLVRVRFTNPNDIEVFLRNEGPYFGDGTYYANSVNGVYDDFEYRGGSPPEVLRSDAPFFMDVAVEVTETARFVWAAVDHLGLVRFNVTNPNGWSTTMPIAHQEGVLVPFGSTIDGYTDDAIRLVAQSTDSETGPNEEAMGVRIRNYAHRLRIVQDDDESVLAVAVHNTSLILSDSLLDEGRAINYMSDGYAGIPVTDPAPLIGGAENYTLIYDLTALVAKPPAENPPDDTQHIALLRDGGRHLHLAADVPSNDKLILFTGRHDYDRGQFATTRELIDLSDGTKSGHRERNAADRPGRWVYSISHSPTNPDVLYTGANDAQVVHDGILVTCGNEIRRFYDATQGNDFRGSMGIIFNPNAIWAGPDPGPGELETDMILGSRRPVPLPDPPHDGAAWMLTRFQPGVDVCDDPPTEEPDHVKRIWVLSPEDALEAVGRLHYMGGIVNEEYDVDVVADQGADKELAFVSRPGTPTGVVVLLRKPLEDRLLSDLVGDGAIFHPNNTTPASFERDLLTHPEYAHIYDMTPPPAGFITNNDLEGVLLTFLPQLVELPAPAASPDDLHWTLAVPSGAVYYPDSLPDPCPQVFQDNFTYSMVQVFDVQDYDEVTDPLAAVPSYTLIGPRLQTAAHRLETLTWQGRTYLFVAHIAGSVIVWDVTDLLDESETVIHRDLANYHDYLIEEWMSPDCISDDLPTNIFDVTADHVQWTEPSGARDEVYLYVAVARAGIEVLRFVPSNAMGQRLSLVKRVETPSGMAGLKIRQVPGISERTLLVGESQAGIRTFVYGE